MAMPQHTSSQGHGVLTARLVAAVIGEMFGCLSQWQTVVIAKDEEIHALRSQLDSVKAANEQQTQALNSQMVYIRSLEYDLARSRVSPRPSSAASLDSYLLLASDSPGSDDEPRSLAKGHTSDQGSHEGLLQRCHEAHEPCSLDGLDQDPFHGLAPLLALAETAADGATVGHTTAGAGTAPESAESTRKRKAEDVAGVAKRARSA
ncbi:hypothetical protein Ct61P_06409 [Colletotrichum tofieldiae]|nr:hypothetical protein Ct61P_06409 [Colletotrichum tofieldiae]